MKVRNGFVSNSSSSSFLVGFKKKPKTRGELRDMMFGDMEGDVIYFDYSLTIDEVVCRVFSDMKDLVKLTPDQILESIEHSYFPGYPDWNERDHERSDKLREEFVQLYNKDYPSNPINGFYHDNARKHPKYEKYAEKIRLLLKEENEIERNKTKIAAEKYYNSIKHLFDGLDVYKFEYSDEGGEAVMEHGGIFENLPAIQLSHH